MRSWVKRLGDVLKVPSIIKLVELEKASRESSVPKSKDILSEVE